MNAFDQFLSDAVSDSLNGAVGRFADGDARAHEVEAGADPVDVYPELLTEQQIPPDTIEASGVCQAGRHDSCTGYTGPESDPDLCECECHEQIAEALGHGRADMPTDPDPRKVTTANAHDNIGRLVTYRSPGWPEHRVEEGTITSANDSYVFVRFPGGSHGVACDPERLRYSIAAPPDAV